MGTQGVLVFKGVHVEMRWHAACEVAKAEAKPDVDESARSHEPLQTR